MAVALGLLTAWAAEPASPLLGATREQVLARLGEPRSQIEAGDRVVFFYAKERVIFRANVVVEVEAIVPEPVRRPPPAPETTTPAPGETAPNGATPGTPPASTPPPAGPAPVAPAASPTPAPSAAAPTATPPPEPKFGIKLVIPPGAKDIRTAPAPAAPEPVAPVVTPAPAVTPAPPPVDPAAAAKAAELAQAKAAAEREALEARKAAERAAAAEKEKKDKAAREARRRLDAAAELESGEGGTSSIWMIAGAAVAALLGFMIWRARQRRLELDVSSVTNVPSTTPAPAAAAPAAPAPVTTFSVDMLGELDAKRFEAVVAAYYSKTGIVANSTQAPAGSPVHIKISWKGEPRPFAYVQCIAQPPGPIEVRPLKELIAVLATDDIRRGYVVTSGAFSAAARDLAQQKQLTLMSGEAFVEKLNALPTAARKEIIQEVGLA